MKTTSQTLQTKALGQVQIEPEQILDFPDGLYGFRDEHEFALVEESPENPFKWLQSTTVANLAFIVIQPELILPDYKPDVSIEELKAIDLQNVSEAVLLLIVTIPEGQPEKMSANLQGPILINRATRKARQSISMNEKHPVRLSILSQMDS